MTDNFFENTLVLFFVNFADVQGTPIDPDVVKFRLKTPDEQIMEYVYGTDPEITRPSPGYYEYRQVLTQPGTHYYIWQGQGQLSVAIQEIVRVLNIF